MTKGRRIKDLRELVGLSQVELAARINVSKQTLYKYENDIITNIPSDKIEAIAKVTNSSPEYIMGWDDSNITQPRTLTPDESSLLDDFNKLNNEGKAEAQKRVNELTEIKKYIGSDDAGVVETA